MTPRCRQPPTAASRSSGQRTAGHRLPLLLPLRDPETAADARQLQGAGDRRLALQRDCQYRLPIRHPARCNSRNRTHPSPPRSTAKRAKTTYLTVRKQFRDEKLRIYCTHTVRKTVPTVPKEPVNHLPGPAVPGRVRSVKVRCTAYTSHVKCRVTVP